MVVNMLDAKTQLSKLVDEALHGGDVQIARNGTALIRLVPVEPLPARPLGSVAVHVPDSFFEPMSEEELAEWE
ncbi:MAG: type II toxin-antitoxin system prevent-host-death family antitoxin [Propionibacteriaceae bacterium]|jgi:prevent-host-death family protein|nr:type II toxin-antitoxin system prevent-host-death family antitoxin [Propionibacteriaceae bacterium]